jgi:hypothetical protein
MLRLIAVGQETKRQRMLVPLTSMLKLRIKVCGMTCCRFKSAGLFPVLKELNFD